MAGWNITRQEIQAKILIEEGSVDRDASKLPIEHNARLPKVIPWPYIDIQILRNGLIYESELVPNSLSH